jgi:hypothetical protein
VCIVWFELPTTSHKYSFLVLLLVYSKSNGMVANVFLQQLGQIQIIGNLSCTCFSTIVKITICLCSVICFAVPLGVLTE